MSDQPLLMSPLTEVSRPPSWDARRLVSEKFRVVSFNTRRALADPGHAIRTLVAICRGYQVRLSAQLRGIRFQAGPGLRVYGSLRLRGPGEVVFGHHVSVLGQATPWTYSRDARIVVGDHVLMGSARFGCMQEITIGDDCILADVSIADTDFHSTRANRRSESAIARVSPVRVARNVWLAQSATLLPGTKIGENSVVSCGAVCMREYPANVIILGNPAKVAAPIPGPLSGESSPTIVGACDG